MMLGLAGRGQGALRREPRPQADDLVGARAQGHQARDHGALPQLAALRALRLDRGRVGHAAAARRADRAPRVGRPRVDRLRAGQASSTPTGNEVPDGEVGELFSCTPYTFDGYLERSREDRRSASRGGYCSVGDMARRDEHGFIHLVDRKSNMIISGGENIYPSEIENLLGRYPGVKDVAVIGVPHDKVGRGGARRDRAARRQRRRRGRTCSSGAATRSPATSGRARSSFIAEAEMPRTATGKIQHRVLRDRFGKGKAA